MSEENKTVETFTDKVTRMFIPIRPKKNAKSLDKTDIQTIDPLERFEKAVLKDSENKRSEKEKN